MQWRGCRSVHHRLRTVMPCANCNSLLIENGSNVMRMNAIEDKGEHAGLLPCSADEAHAGDCSDSLRGISEQIVFVNCDVAHAKPIELLTESQRGLYQPH